MIARAWRRIAAGLVASAALACGAHAAGAQPAAEGGDAARQVLVLLRLPPPHMRPGSDYAGGYGAGLDHAARLRIAGRLARAHGLTLVGDWPMPILGVDCFIMSVPEGRSPDAEAAALSREPGVEWAEPSHIYRAQAAVAPNDPLYRAEPAAREWRLADLHQIATGRDVRVAVIDSKIQDTHPDLAGQVQVSSDFVPDHPDGAEAHGTGVAGIIAAKADNGVGIVGVAPRARLMALRACWQSPGHPSATICDTLSLAKAMHFAVDHDAQVINLSFSGPPDTLLGKLVDVAIGRGATVVAAFDRGLPGGGFPASHHGVIAVVDESLDAPPAGVYSAPGRDVPTTQPGGRWYLVSGSSYATAHVSGLFALARQRNPSARGAAALASGRAGGGVIDACATLLRAAGPCDCACSRPFADNSAPRR
jgi:hypothetical protein